MLHHYGLRPAISWFAAVILLARNARRGGVISVKSYLILLWNSHIKPHVRAYVDNTAFGGDGAIV